MSEHRHLERSHVNYSERHVLVNIAFNFETQRGLKKNIFNHIVFYHRPGNAAYDWLGNSVASLVLMEPGLSRLGSDESGGRIGQPVCQQQIDANESYN